MVDGGTAGGGSGPVRAVLTVRVGAGDSEAFARAWSVVAAWAGSQPGCLRQTLCREDGVPGVPDPAGVPGVPDPAGVAGGSEAADEAVFTITSDWCDERTFRAFERSDDQDAVTAELRRLRRSARMRLVAIVAHVPG